MPVSLLALSVQFSTILFEPGVAVKPLGAAGRVIGATEPYEVPSRSSSQVVWS